MNVKKSLMTLALTCLPLSAWAGGTVIIQYGSGDESYQSRIEFDGNKLRMDSAGMGEQGYLLLRDSRLYTVSNQDGQIMVVDMSSMGRMFGSMLPTSMGVDDVVNDFSRLEATGRSETVAGVRGQVYYVSFEDEDGRQRREELVIGNDSVLREFSVAMQGFTLAMANMLGISETEMASGELLSRGDGILRVGEDYRLVSINNVTPAAVRFDLPAEPMEMPDFGSILSEAGLGSEGDEGGVLGGLFDRMTQRQSERVESRTGQEVDQAADRAVDGVLNRAFNRLRNL